MQVAGLMPNTLPNREDGTFDLSELATRVKLAQGDIHSAVPRLVCIENSAAGVGGKPLPFKWLREVTFRYDYYSCT